MDILLVTSILSVTIRAGTSLLYAILGEILTERSGILNLGVEGVMIIGALAGYAVSYSTGSLWLGVLSAMLAGAAMAFIHGFLSITAKANQVVSGVALTIFGSGLSNLLGKQFVSVVSPRFTRFEIPYLSKIPILGQAIFNQDVLIYISLLLSFVLWIFLYKTRPGLNLRAVGEDPRSADAMGINVNRTRYLFTLIGGMLMGLGGAHLSLAFAPGWQENLTAGRGWIAVALVIFASWDPLRAIIASIVFGGIEGIQFMLQAQAINISPYFLRMLPYASTILILWVVSWREGLAKQLGGPSSLSLPFDREDRT